MSPRVLSVRYKVPCSLIVTFTNHEVKEFDLRPYLNYPVFQKLRDESYFRKVHVRDGIVTWDDETDFDPDTIYLEGEILK